MANGQSGALNPSAKKDFFGHPRGLATLFFTEFWERFSYYGMRALLVLYLVAAATGDNPGLDMSIGMATAIYGIYTFFVYVLSLPGGWVADNLWGQRKSVFVGGCVIALGHFTMAGPLIGLPEATTFYLGLAFITIGTGLLKPNVSVMVGGLYPEGGARRDAGFSIFYMGINFGAIVGPTLCSILGEGYNWHWGFSLAGFGMLIGLIWYKYSEKYLGDIGKMHTNDSAEALSSRSRKFYIITAISVGVVCVVAWMISAGTLGITLEQLARFLGVSVALIAVVYFTYLILNVRWVLAVLAFAAICTIGYAEIYDSAYLFAYQIGIVLTVVAFLLANIVRVLMPDVKVSLEKKRLMVIFWLFILAALFWSGFEQAGASLNIFAEQATDRFFGPFGWIESIGPIVLAAAVALLLGYLCYRVIKRENLWSLIKGIVVFISAGLVVASYFLFADLAQGWSMPASMLQNINPLWIVILAPVFGSLWVWLAKHNANPSIPVKFALGLFGLAAGFFVISWGAAANAGAEQASAGWLVVTYFLFTVGELCLSPVGLSSMTKLAPEGKGSQMMGVWFVAAALGSLFAGLISGSLETMAPSNLFWVVALIVGGGGLVALLASPFVQRLMGDVE